MVQKSKLLSFMLGTATLVAAVPTPTAAPEVNPALLQKRASCTFTAASAASASKKSCATIVLNNIAVPSGTTLDLTGLTSGTSVIFEGETTWGYEEWSGPLLSISGENIAISGKSGHVLNGGGARWWDTLGSNGGKTKPKFFYAHKLTGSSSIKGINILNTPIQAVSVNGASGLTISDMTIDNSAGDANKLGHNTDAFDVGSSTGITITGAKVKNQDDCLAINSGSISPAIFLSQTPLSNSFLTNPQNIKFTGGTCSGGHGLSIGSVGGRTDNDVSDITISSSTISNSQNGVRIKSKLIVNINLFPIPHSLENPQI